MSKEEIISAIERTIEEAREYRRLHPEDATTAIDMDKHRRSLEIELNMYKYTHPNPLRAVASSIIGPASFVLSPVIVAGGLLYIAGREVYRRMR